jgi:hypothetical protein
MTIDVDRIYDQLRKMEVSLEEQNYANHHYYQKVLTKCDLYVSILSKYYATARQECSKLQVQYNIQAEEIESKRRHHVANNEEIQRRYSTGREREMAIEVILKDEIADLKKKDNRLIILKDLVGVLNTWLGIMRERKRDAKEQWKILCEQSKAANLPDPTDKSVRELNKVIGELEAEAAEAGMDDNLIIEDDITSEEYIEGDEESDNEVLEATEETPSDIAVDDSEDYSVNTDDIEIAPGLTGPAEKSEKSEDSSEISEIQDNSDTSSEDDPDILDMLPSGDSNTKVDESSEEIQVESSDQPAMEPTEEATQKEPEDDNSEEVGLEDDLLDGLDEIDEGILAGVESAEQSGRGGASKSKTAKAKDGAVVTGVSPDQTKTVVAEAGEPTSKATEAKDIDVSVADNSPPKESKPEGQGKDTPKEPVEKEDAASVSTDVDIEDILGELDEL